MSDSKEEHEKGPDLSYKSLMNESFLGAVCDPARRYGSTKRHISVVTDRVVSSLTKQSYNSHFIVCNINLLTMNYNQSVRCASFIF